MVRLKRLASYPATNRESVVLTSLLVLLIFSLTIHLLFNMPQPVGIRDIAWVSHSKILVAASPYNGRIYTSRDFGETWNVAEYTISNLFASPNGRIWGNHSNVSPHGPLKGPGYLIYSTDGIVWETIELEPQDLRPMNFLSPPGELPVFLSFDGTIWRLDNIESPADWESWSALEDFSSICRWGCRSGLVIDDLIYAGTGILNEGIAIAGKKQKVSVFKTRGPVSTFWRHNDICWASTDGRGEQNVHVYSTTCGRNDWELVSSIEELDYVSDMKVYNSHVYIAGEGNQWRALIAEIDPNTGEYTISDIVGKHKTQALAIQLDGLGRLWVGTSHGLFREDRDGWIQVDLP